MSIENQFMNPYMSRGLRVTIFGKDVSFYGKQAVAIYRKEVRGCGPRDA